jgi:chromosome segregation and condensation protein ScpB
VRSSASGNKVLKPLDLPETVWLVLAIVILDQPITRAEITARRMADSDRQVQVPLGTGHCRHVAGDCWRQI